MVRRRGDLAAVPVALSAAEVSPEALDVGLPTRPVLADFPEGDAALRDLQAGPPTHRGRMVLQQLEHRPSTLVRQGLQSFLHDGERTKKGTYQARYIALPTLGRDVVGCWSADLLTEESLGDGPQSISAVRVQGVRRNCGRPNLWV